MTTRRDLIAGVALTALAVAMSGSRAFGQTPGAAKPPPLELLDFYLAPTTADVALSPSGKRVAVLRNRYTEAGVASTIDVVDADNPNQPPKTISIGRHETNAVTWANETRLLVGVVYDVTHKGFETERIGRAVASV